MLNTAFERGSLVSQYGLRNDMAACFLVLGRGGDRGGSIVVWRLLVPFFWFFWRISLEFFLFSSRFALLALRTNCRLFLFFGRHDQAELQDQAGPAAEPSIAVDTKTRQLSQQKQQQQQQRSRSPGQPHESSSIGDTTSTISVTAKVATSPAGPVDEGGDCGARGGVTTGGHGGRRAEGDREEAAGGGGLSTADGVFSGVAGTTTGTTVGAGAVEPASAVGLVADSEGVLDTLLSLKVADVSIPDDAGGTHANVGDAGSSSSGGGAGAGVGVSGESADAGGFPGSGAALLSSAVSGVVLEGGGGGGGGTTALLGNSRESESAVGVEGGFRVFGGVGTDMGKGGGRGGGGGGGDSDELEDWLDGMLADA